MIFGLQAGALAHHTYVTKYDPKKKITISGVITSVNYYNPHIVFTLLAQNRSGGETEWRVETESIQITQGRGLTKSILKIGRRVTVTGWRARNGSAELGLSSLRPVRGKWIRIKTSPR